MLAYVGRRILQSLPVLVGISFAAFMLIHVVPGDPAQVMLGPRATPEALATVRTQLGLDQPLGEQYLDFLKNAVTLDFGQSVFKRVSVGSLLGGRIVVTLALVAYAVVIAIAIAVPLAIGSALRRNRPLDHSIRLFSTVAFAMPAFWLGLMLILLFSLKLGWLPTSGLGEGIGGYLRGLTLPALTIGLYLAPLLLRTLRTSIIETRSTEFVEAARARGFGRLRVLRRYVLRNSLVSSVTVLGVLVGFLLSGTVVVESVFGLEGLGSLLVNSVQTRDLPIVQALALVFGVLVIGVNLLVDLSYAALDPRIRP